MVDDLTGADPERDASRGGSVTRREALRRTGLGLLAGTLAVAPSPSQLGATGASRRRAGRRALRLDRPALPLSPLGVQLYTLREAMSESVEATLERVAAIGYREVEFAGYFDRTPEEIRRAVDAAGLSAPSAHVGVETLEDWPATLDAAVAVGHDWIVVASLPPEMTGTLDDWRRVAERFEAAGEEARDRGIGLAFHNHAGAARAVDGVVPLDLLLRRTSPEHVSVQADVYWLVEGGTDPVAFLERWPGRIPSLHVKDRTADGAMEDVGAGVIDWPGVLSAGRDAGVEHHFVEHDRPADPFASAEASYRYLSHLELP
ncbi:MAG: sugar phosphate isomerase/epimerase family protein [Gemmatimonadota bacterium]